MVLMACLSSRIWQTRLLMVFMTTVLIQVFWGPATDPRWTHGLSDGMRVLRERGGIRFSYERRLRGETQYKALGAAQSLSGPNRAMKTREQAEQGVEGVLNDTAGVSSGRIGGVGNGVAERGAPAAAYDPSGKELDAEAAEVHDLWRQVGVTADGEKMEGRGAVGIDSHEGRTAGEEADGFEDDGGGVHAERATSLSPRDIKPWRSTKRHEEVGMSVYGVRPSGRYEPRVERFDFTLVSQCSADRLWMLPHICERWKGPIVVAVFAPGKHDVNYRALAKACQQARVINVETPKGRSLRYWSQPDHFPVNSLRNMAISEVSTSHFLVIDMDLWPSVDLYDTLRSLAAQHSTRFADPFQAFVVPAFSLYSREGLTERETPTEDIPTDGKGLGRCIDAVRCNIFDGAHNAEGHGTTDYAYWLDHQRHDELRDIPCFQSNRYEPYVVVRRGAPTPHFAEAFTGYGKNKIQHIAHLRFRGFRFSVVPSAFLVHYPHAVSQAKESWLSRSNTHRRRMDVLYSHFVRWASNERAAREGDHTRICKERRDRP